MSAFSLFSVCSLLVSCLVRAAPLARSQAALTIDNRGVLSSTDSSAQRPTPLTRKEALAAAIRHTQQDRYFQDFWKMPDRNKNISAASLGQGFRSGGRGPKMSGYENNDCGGSHYSSVTLPEDADLIGDQCIALRDSTSDAPFGRMKIMCESDTGVAKVCIWNTPQESSCTSNEPVCLAIDNSFTGQVSGGKCVPVKSHPDERDAYWRFADFPPETVWPYCLVPPLETSKFGMVFMGGICIGIFINCVLWIVCIAPPKNAKSMPPPGFGFGGKGEGFGGKGEGLFFGGKGEDLGGKGEGFGGKGPDGKGEGFGGKGFGFKGEVPGGKGEGFGGKGPDGKGEGFGGKGPDGKGEGFGGKGFGFKGEVPGGKGEFKGPDGKGEAPGGKGEGQGWKGGSPF